MLRQSRSRANATINAVQNLLVAVLVPVSRNPFDPQTRQKPQEALVVDIEEGDIGAEDADVKGRPCGR